MNYLRINAQYNKFIYGQKKKVQQYMGSNIEFQCEWHLNNLLKGRENVN